MAINFNNQNQGIGTLDLSQFGLMQPQNQNMQVAGAYDTPTAGEYGFNLIELDRLKNAGYDPAELSTYPNQEDVQSIIRNLEPTANANNIMTDANVDTASSIIQDEQGNLIDTENRVQFGNEKFDSEPYEYTPNYLGANSPMLDVEGDEYGYKFTYNNDPAFGKLKSYLSGSTGYPQNQNTLRSEYFDTGEQVPSLQRALGNERFAMAPEQPDFINAPQDFYQQYSQPKELGFIESAPQPKEAIYQDRIMNNNLSNSNYEPKQGILQGLQDKIGAGFNNVKDFAMDKGRMGRNLLGSAGAMAMGLPGIVGSGAMALMGGLKNQFQDRQLTGDIQDEYGNMYSADELNSQNALGGYYTDPARSARRRTSRIAKMRARDFNNKKISQTNLDRLVRQEKAQQLRDAKDAADRANIQNVQNYTGRELSGYRMSRPASERNYTGGSTNSNPSARGAQDSFSNKSGMGRTGYQEGGLASMFTRRR
jgi:hypothetical protein